MQSKPTDWSIYAIVAAWIIVMGGSIALNVIGIGFPMWGASLLSFACTIGIVIYRVRDRVPMLLRRLNF